MVVVKTLATDPKNSIANNNMGILLLRNKQTDPAIKYFQKAYPFSAWLAEHPKNTIVKGTVTEVDARGATLDLGDGVLGSLRSSEMARGQVEDARTMIKIGEKIEAKFTNVDRKNRTIALSIKAKEVHEEAEAMDSYKTEEGATPVGTTLGELLKEKMTGGGK
jgi:small subunit ribosomal protein S1